MIINVSHTAMLKKRSCLKLLLHYTKPKRGVDFHTGTISSIPTTNILTDNKTFSLYISEFCLTGTRNKEKHANRNISSNKILKKSVLLRLVLLKLKRRWLTVICS